ncbi:zf-TFIIB domain-containing protein [Entomomonas asaccharolytica]|uniref:Zf-TFIIB domain-containing protein n=1 Tax=Entomomonas asaccharolytica TaxID=2785331 RepID=A0A974RVQ2_9GAMM|nr:zf-TFIIB domain-containing protein [Entomomonas asaccharolytica]QQP84411.1 zf-TFIIB domain-containing protein [Entomomonas asaccharolytica]
MKCPSCQQGELKYSQLEESLPCQTCNHCAGNWLLLIDYLSWQSVTKFAPTPEEINTNTTIEVDETRRALLCPVSGKLMTKFRISSKTTHKIDLSTTVNGIWLDKGEWELLKQQGLSHKLNSIFTEPYQKSIREELASKSFAEHYQQQFGEETYQKLKTFRAWLDKQDKRAALLAYLIAEDPYSANR